MHVRMRAENRGVVGTWYRSDMPLASITFLSDGRFGFDTDGDMVTDSVGHYRVEPGFIVSLIADSGGSPRCGIARGTYGIDARSEVLRFVPLSDGCADREVVLATRWVRLEPHVVHLATMPTAARLR